MADAFESMIDRLSQAHAKTAALTEAVRVLIEALESLTGEQPPRGEDYLKANAALTQAKELLK
jgi:outer membrane protein TolC